MRAPDVWKAVTMDRADLLTQVIGLLRDLEIRYCVIDGQAVNAYVEPLVSLDLDLVVAADQVDALEARLRSAFRVEQFPHSLNVSQPDSDLRVQIQMDPRYAKFLERTTELDVLGTSMPVAAVDDVLEGKVWAASDSTRRPSKRQKDLADIARLLERFPHLRDRVPPEILVRLV